MVESLLHFSIIKMNSNIVEYDLDTSGGLMPQIQALIAPPVSEEPSKKVKREKRRELGQSYYRKHGRAINHDYCDSCRESGNLLCCDRCPAAFHLECLDPPIDEDDLPSGEWMCHRCSVAQRESEDDQVSTCSEQSNGRNSHMSDKNESNDIRIIVDDLDKDDMTYQDSSFVALKDYDRERELAVGVALRKGRRQCTIQKKKTDNNSVNRELPSGSSNSSGNGSNVCKTGMKPIVIDIDENETPLQTLIKVASVMNPKQFHLPPELTCTTHLPGTRKRLKQKDFRPKKVPYELDNGLVPLPVQLCHECDQSCKKAPLLKCDYCPYLYHLDCLNSPLTVMPTGRWMCPAHPDHLIDQKLLISTSLSERIKLRNEFSAPISQDAVKLQFLKKIQRKNPPFRYKVTLPARKRVQVPNAVKEHYKNRPPLLPRLWDPVTVSDLDMGKNLSGEQQQSHSMSSEQELWLQSILSLHCEIAEKLSSNTSESNEVKKVDSENMNCIEPMDIDEGCKRNLENVHIENKTTDDDVSKTDCQITKNVTITAADSVNGKTSVKKTSINEFSSVLEKNDPKDNITRKKSNIRSEIDDLIEATNFKGSTDAKMLEKSRDLNLCSKEYLDCYFDDGEINIAKLDKNIITLLALERLKQLFPPKEFSQDVPESDKNEITKKKSRSSEVRARAVISSCNAKAPPCSMSYRSLTIGSGADTDLCLRNYGYCSYISGKHAAIFYDETTKHYELLNYSEHGTTVDNVLYSCDFSDKKPPAPAQPNTIVSAVRGIIDKNRKKKFQTSVKCKPLTMSSCSVQKHKSCGCKASSSSMIGGSGAGWEGTAILHHGSYIKCGCLQFVFSIIDGSPNCYVSTNDPSLKSGR